MNGFWAPKYPDVAILFTIGHQNVLYEHGLGYFTSNELYWHGFDDVYVALVFKGDEAVAGLRLETKVKERMLPLEKALKSRDNKVTEFVEGLSNHKVFEVCGLWNSKKYAGYDFATFLCRACLAIAPQLGFDVSLSLNGFYTYRIPKDIGCRMVTSVGEGGRFAYPVKRFHSAIWIQDDLDKISLASDECKQLVKAIRAGGEVRRKEQNKIGEIEIIYNLDT